MLKTSKNGGQIQKIAKFLSILTILSGHIYMHWSPDPDVMYSKAQRGPKLSLSSIKWPIYVQNVAKYFQNE